MDIVQKKIDKITHHFVQKEIDRKLEAEKKRENKNQNLAEHENIEFFEESFLEKQLEIENALNSSGNIKTNDLPKHFDIISKNILNLQKFVASCNIFLRVYDIKKCHQVIQELTIRAKELEDRLLPKKKFGFKNRNKPVPQSTSSKLLTNGHLKDEVDYCKKINLHENLYGYENKKNENLMLDKSKLFKKDITLRNMENCIVKLEGSPSTLHLNQLNNCAIFSGPVSTSIFAENCTNCKFIIACQQLRLHSSSNIHIYLHVTSRAIMEDCDKISLAPYNYQYDGLEKDFANSGLDIKINNWISIDDFNWLNADAQSPNWNILNDADKVLDWNNFQLST